MAQGEGHLEARERAELLETLEARFEANQNRHGGIRWRDVRGALEDTPDKLWSLAEMERTGDCSAQSPAGRRSVCYDREALEARKTHKPEGSAVEMAFAMGAELLTEEEYRSLQELGDFDTTTSSWLRTPADIRARGGAIFGDFRYGAVFVYHNGAQSYYASRGFRCWLRV